MAKFGQFSRFIKKKMYLSYWSHFTTSLLYTSYSAPQRKTGGGGNYYGICGIQEDKGVVIPPKISISPQIWTGIRILSFFMVFSIFSVIIS